MSLKHVDPRRRANPAMRAAMRFGRSRVGQLFAKHVAARTDISLGRMSSGRLNWGMFNVPSATLQTVGAKSGQRRSVQLAYFHDDDDDDDGDGDVIVIASNFGGSRHPSWYYNLVARPDCKLNGVTFVAHEVTDPAEYARLYGLAEQYYQGFADYRAMTAAVGRTIPLMRLSHGATTPVCPLDPT